MSRYLWPGVKMWVYDASLSYNNGNNVPGVGCNGIAIFLAKKWSNLQIDDNG